MKNDHVVLDFVKEPIPQKIETAHNVQTEMSSNRIFINPDVPFEELKACNDLLQTRYIASLSGGKEETALFHQAEEVWIDKMRKTAKYVDRIADGDGAIILSAGFNLVKQRSPANRAELTVELGDKSGSVLLRRQRVVGARSYIWQYCIGEAPASEADWTNAQVTTQATVELTGLTPLIKYWFRVAAVTINGTTAYCKPVMQAVI